MLQGWHYGSNEFQHEEEMNQQTISQHTSQILKEKRPYFKPELNTLGLISELTAGGSGLDSELTGNGNSCSQAGKKSCPLTPDRS
jgi:hypothetical protein